MADQDAVLLQRHFANLRHIRDVFQIDPRAQRGTGQIAPWLSGFVQLTYPAFPGAFQFNAPEVRSFAAPAVATEHVITIPPNEIWRLRAFRVLLTNDANAANRQLFLFFDDTANTFLRIPPTANQLANEAEFHSFAPVGYSEHVGEHLSGLPDMFLNTGWRIQTETVGIQAGDQLGVANLLIEVFPV